MVALGVTRIVGIAVATIFIVTLVVSLSSNSVIVFPAGISSTTIPKKVNQESQVTLLNQIKQVNQGSSPTVLFVVNTHEENYATRVKAIRETYLKRVREKKSLDLIFVSSQMADGSPDMFQTTCPMGYREDSCKRADMMTIAGGYLRRPGMERFEWIYFIDDDAYILPDNAQRVIQKSIETEKDLTAVFATRICDFEGCIGICGGGGYYMNRETLYTILNGGDKAKYPTLRHETDVYDKACGRCGDLTISKAIEEIHGVPVKPYPVRGVYIWIWDLDGQGDEAIIKSLKQKDPNRLPFLYHYPALNRFHQFYAWVTEFGANKELAD